MSQSQLPQVISPTPNSKKRSRTGCERCRRRRQKCDETRPSCSRCKTASATCSYQLNIRWGGREFAQSAFGNCDTHKIELEAGQFVYSVMPPFGPSRQSREDQEDRFQQIDQQMDQQMLSIPISLASLPQITPQLQGLLEYFVQRGSLSISTNRRVQDQTCRALVPVALEAPALLHAITAFAAAHEASLTGDEAGQTYLAALATRLRMKSIRILREEIMSSTTSSGMQSIVVMASSLILCLSALYNAVNDYNSWRVYLCGARAAFPAVNNTDGGYNDTLSDYLRKRYHLFEALAMLSQNGFAALHIDHDELKLPPQPSTTLFEDFFACNTDVLRLLRTVGAVAWEKRRLQVDPSGLLCETDFYLEADNLEAEALQMIDRDQKIPLEFTPEVRETLVEAEIKDFDICNQIYGHTALLEIRTSIKGLASDEPRVQEPVKKIIELATLIVPRPGLSPALGLNTALFCAGQHALGEDRRIIKTALNNFYATTRNRNSIVTLEHLKLRWSGEARMNGMGDDLTSTDFIPY